MNDVPEAVMEESADRQAGSTEPTQADVTPEAIVEALLFSSDDPLTSGKIAQILGIGDSADVKKHIATLNERYEASGSSFHISEIAKGFQMFTHPEYHPWVGKLRKARSESRLSGAAVETLAIVAYRQPVLRADVEAIRGVAVGDRLVRLRDLSLVRIVGRADEVGRPLLYGTTKKFLEIFGLASLKDLPKLDPDHPGDIPPLKVVTEESDAEVESSSEPIATDAGNEPCAIESTEMDDSDAKDK